MTFSDLEGATLGGQIFRADLRNYARINQSINRIVRPRTTTFGKVAHVGSDVFLYDQPQPHPKGAGPSVLKFFGTPYLCPYRLT